ncbi:MAG: hypothetical protein ACJ77A_04545 [Actinomycetota bacterium]
MSYRGQLAVVEPGGASGEAVPASVDVGQNTLTIVPERGDPITLAYIDVDDVFDDDYTLRLTDFAGRRYDLSMLGRAYGQVLADVRQLRNDLLQHDLLLTGVDLQDTFPARFLGQDGSEPVACEVRLFEDLMVVVPERGVMWGLPYSFVDEIRFDEELYQTHVVTDDGGDHVFGMAGLRSQELPGELRRLLDALATRTGRSLGALVPGLEPAVLSRLAGRMRDGRAVQQREVDGIAAGVWPRLVDAVVGTPELRSTFDLLASMCPPGWPALGVKAVVTEEEGSPGGVGSGEDRVEPEPPAADDGPSAEEGGATPEGIAGVTEDETGRDRTILWFFTPLADGGVPRNAVAQEITSEKGHATYVFRLMDPEAFRAAQAAGPDAVAGAVSAAVARLNRALLTLNFRREPIYLPDDQIATSRYAKYRVALRRLDYLQWTRAAFLGRAIHNATWEQQLHDLVARA